MNRTLKRVLGLTGSVALGLAGAVTFASAAQAHHVEIEGVPECADGGWTVTWNVEDWFHQSQMGPGVIKEIIAEPDVAIEGDIALETPLPPLDTETPLQGIQMFGEDVTSAKLTIWAEWPNGEYEKGEGTVTAPTDCEPESDPEPKYNVSVGSDCFGIHVTAANQNPDALAEFTFEPSVGESVTETPEADGEFYKYFLHEDPEEGISVSVYVDGELLETYDWAYDSNCEWGSYPESTCDGLEFVIAIPENAPETTYTFTPSNGEEFTEILTPGESKTVSLNADGSEEFSVYLIIDDGKIPYDGTVSWTKPEDCDEAPPTEEETTPAASEQLPSTGSSMTIMISTAAALVVAAAVLFFIARRRRTASDW